MENLIYNKNNNGIQKIAEYREGLITYRCNKCNHVINKSKTVKTIDFKCMYCGEKV